MIIFNNHRFYLLLGRIKKYCEDKCNIHKSASKVFSEIYKKHLWGSDSGLGSNSWAYKNMIINFLKSNNNKTVVDLGCGDFRTGKSFVTYCLKYIGVDIVPELINRLKFKHQKENVKFICSNIIEDNLPDGDICLIRQVFQHLSNAEITKVLTKLKKYETVFITEHQPDICKTPNKDMVHGSKIRLFNDSGVYLNKPPFNIQNLELVLEVPGKMGRGYTSGKIRTYKRTYK